MSMETCASWVSANVAALSTCVPIVLILVATNAFDITLWNQEKYWATLVICETSISQTLYVENVNSVCVYLRT